MAFGVRSIVPICLVVAAAVASGCDDDTPEAGAAGQAIERTEDIAGKEEDLLARRDALVKARERIRSERDELAAARKVARESGSDTSALDERANKLLADERDLVAQEAELNKRYREILSQRRKMMEQLASAGGGPVARVATRESSVAVREQDLARRESALAEREQALAQRERVLARREAETCGVAAAPATIIKTIDAKGSSYRKKDVEPLLKQARKRMADKGIRKSDLPSPAQDLEKEATKAMSEGDYGRARFAANQLVSTVRSIKINKSFIQGKFSRLSAAMKGKTLSKRKQSQVDKLFKDATANYGDGKFGSANRRLNKIYSVIR